MIAKAFLVFVVGHEFHIEATQFFREGPTVVAKTDDTYRFSIQLNPPIPFTIPNAVAHITLGRMQLVHEREQHSESMFTHRISISFRRIEKLNASFFAIRLVDVFHSSTRTCDEFQVRGELQKLFIHGKTRTNDDSVSSFCLFQTAFFAPIPGFKTRIACASKSLSENGMNGIKKQNSFLHGQ